MPLPYPGTADGTRAGFAPVGFGGLYIILFVSSIDVGDKTPNTRTYGRVRALTYDNGGLIAFGVGGGRAARPLLLPAAGEAFAFGGT